MYVSVVFIWWFVTQEWDMKHIYSKYCLANWQAFSFKHIAWQFSSLSRWTIIKVLSTTPFLTFLFVSGSYEYSFRINIFVLWVSSRMTFLLYHGLKEWHCKGRSSLLQLVYCQNSYGSLRVEKSWNQLTYFDYIVFEVKT